MNVFVWNDQWDFRRKNFCPWCLIQVLFWAAHRDCQCLRRARQNFLCIGRIRFLWSIFTTFWHIWPLCPLILWLPPPGMAKFLVQTMASWVFLWPIFATFCHSAVLQKIVSWFENLWKEIRKELKQLFLLMLKFKVSQELDVHLSVLFYVAMSKRLEIQS